MSESRVPIDWTLFAQDSAIEISDSESDDMDFEESNDNGLDPSLDILRDKADWSVHDMTSSPLPTNEASSNRILTPLPIRGTSINTTTSLMGETSSKSFTITGLDSKINAAVPSSSPNKAQTQITSYFSAKKEPIAVLHNSSKHFGFQTSAEAPTVNSGFHHSQPLTLSEGQNLSATDFKHISDRQGYLKSGYQDFPGFPNAEDFPSVEASSSWSSLPSLSVPGSSALQLSDDSSPDCSSDWAQDSSRLNTPDGFKSFSSCSYAIFPNKSCSSSSIEAFDLATSDVNGCIGNAKTSDGNVTPQGTATSANSGLDDTLAPPLQSPLLEANSIVDLFDPNDFTVPDDLKLEYEALGLERLRGQPGEWIDFGVEGQNF